MAYIVSNSDSATLSNQGESITSLTQHGGRSYTTSRSKYVIHTHTIPLATVLDQQYLLRHNFETSFHGKLETPEQELNCSTRSCMYIYDSNKRSSEKLKTNCPCLKIREERELQPLCFLMYVRALNHNLSDLRNPDLKAADLNPEEIMFCQTASGCFDNSYPGYIRDRIKITGWSHVSERELIPLLNCLYWFRKFSDRYDLKKRIMSFLRDTNLKITKHIVKQCIHTVNSLIVKKLLAFSPEIEGYKDLARHTAWAFSELFKDYSLPTLRKDGKPIEPDAGFYKDCKDFSNTVKETFHSSDRERRMSWLTWKPTTKAFGAFFGVELKRLGNLIESRTRSEQSDYTLSPAFMFRAITLSQSRGLGYLPDRIAECKRAAFRVNINREVDQSTPRRTRLQYLAVQKRLREAGFPLNLLKSGKDYADSDVNAKEMFENIFSHIEMTLKGSASFNHFVKQGGKLEDARLLMNLAIKNEWEIPIRDLETFEILETFSVSRETEGETDYSRPLFWLSLQLVINHWCNKEQWDKKFYYKLLDNSEEYKPQVMEASIVHVSEAGKERNLTKSTGIYTWFLTPASKVTQASLGYLSEHKAGLLDSGHEWKHQQRISAESNESDFIYDANSGKTHEDIVHVFKDWTESTDYIGKTTGWAHLSGLMDYIGFPHMYGQLVLKTIVEEQPVEEVVTISFVDDKEERSTVHWHGAIREGFMMGNPMTKTILHLVHVSEYIIAKEFLSRRGIRFREPGKLTRFTDRAKLDRELAGKNQTTIVTI